MTLRLEDNVKRQNVLIHKLADKIDRVCPAQVLPEGWQPVTTQVLPNGWQPVTAQVLPEGWQPVTTQVLHSNKQT